MDRITILVDTREQRNGHILERFSQLRIPFCITTLSYGDYSFTLGDTDYRNKCVVERKASLTELANNIGSKRIQFETEFVKAHADTCNMMLLIEDANARAKMTLRREMDSDCRMDIETKYRKTWRSELCANSMIGTIRDWKKRYEFELMFCNKANTGDRMLAFFYAHVEGGKTYG